MDGIFFDNILSNIVYFGTLLLNCDCDFELQTFRRVANTANLFIIYIEFTIYLLFLFVNISYYNYYICQYL